MGFTDEGPSDFGRPAPALTRPSVGVVGARGRMGRWVADWLRGQGVEPACADQGDEARLPELARQCQVIVLAVPVRATAQVMAALGPHTRPDGLVVDLGSLKAEPLAAMLAHARGAVAGAHPLFGPDAQGLAGREVFLCPGRGRRWLAWLRALLAGQGARVRVMDAAAHDRLMAKVQTLRHLTLACWGAALDELGFSAAELAMAGPWTGALLEMLAHQAAQPAELYAGLAAANPHAPAIAQALAKAVGQAAQLTDHGDATGLAALLTRGHLMASQVAKTA